MLSEVYETDGKKHRTYKATVKYILGPGHCNTLATVLYIKMFMNAVSQLPDPPCMHAVTQFLVSNSPRQPYSVGTPENRQYPHSQQTHSMQINYTIAGATSMQFIANTACEWQGTTGGCMSGVWAMTGLFSCLQLLLNMLPDLESIWWVSLIGSIMSYAYSTIALALSLWSISIYGVSKSSSLFGKGGSTPFTAAMAVFQAFGNLAYAWSCAALIFSIQSTLKEPPKAVESMGKTIKASFATTAAFYISVACAGYAALGATAPGDVLTGFSVSNEVELIANVTVLLHMIAVVQVYTQPLFEAFEHAIVMPYAPHLLEGKKLLLFRFVYRGISTAIITAVGASVPFFSLFGGLIGSVSYWPLQVS